MLDLVCEKQLRVGMDETAIGDVLKFAIQLLKAGDIPLVQAVCQVVNHGHVGLPQRFGLIHGKALGRAVIHRIPELAFDAGNIRFLPFFMAQKPMRIAQIKERRAVPVGKIALTRLHCQKAFLVNRMLSLIRDTAERTGLSVKPGVARIGANRLVGPVSGLRQGDPDAKRIPPIPKSGTPDPRSGRR